MSGRKTTGSKTKSSTHSASRATAKPPMPPHALRGAGVVTTGVPAPQSHVDKLAEAAAKTLKSPSSGAPKAAKNETPDNAADTVGTDAIELKKQELIALIVERSDVAKKYAKPVIEAMLDVLGEALAEGRELNLQPMGKIKQNRVKETAKARVIVAKIRQQKPGASGQDGVSANTKEAVADAAE
ncbi:HU family DNA-binding protein [Roseovarius aestuarii]|nr:HU family DNA-binding protein [Roseovarius aestuarii]